MRRSFTLIKYLALVFYFWFTTFAPPALAQSAPTLDSVEIVTFDSAVLHAVLAKSAIPTKGCVLMMHGLQGNSAWFVRAGLPQFLSNAGFTVLAFDRRGSGRSPRLAAERNAPTQIPGHAKYIFDIFFDTSAALHFLNSPRGECENKKIHIVAESFAFAPALNFASALRERISSIVMLAPTPLGSLKFAARFKWSTLGRIALADSQTEFSSPISPELLLGNINHPLDLGSAGLSSLVEIRAWLESEASARQSRFTAGFLMSANHELRRAQLLINSRTVTHPILVLQGEADQIVDNNAASSALHPLHYSLHYYTRTLPRASHLLAFSTAAPELRAEILTWLMEWSN